MLEKVAFGYMQNPKTVGEHTDCRGQALSA